MDSNELALTGQVALVTGASSGLGRATALALAQAGADVVLLARSAEDLQRVVTELTSSGRRVVALPGDVAHEDDIVNAVTHAIETFGHIDILVNAAGIDIPGPIVHLATSDWGYVLDVNLRAPFLLAKAVFPHMSAARHDRQHLLGGWQTWIGQCLSVLRLQIRSHWPHTSTSC